MGAFENFPYTNFHDLNLDWIVKKVQALEISYENVGAAIQAVLQELIDDGSIEQWVGEAVAAQAPLTKLYTQMVRNEGIEDWALQSMAEYESGVLICGFKNYGQNTETKQSMIMAVDAATGQILGSAKNNIGEVGTVAVNNGTAYFKDANQYMLWKVTYAAGTVTIDDQTPLVLSIPETITSAWIAGDDDGVYTICSINNGAAYHLYDVNLSTGVCSNMRDITGRPYKTKQLQGTAIKGDRLYWVNGSSGCDVFQIRDSDVVWRKALNIQERPSQLWDMGELEIVAPALSDNGDFWVGGQYLLPVGKSNVSNKNFMRCYSIARANAFTSVIGDGTKTNVQLQDIRNAQIYVDATIADKGYRDGSASHPFKLISEALYMAQSLDYNVVTILVKGTPHTEYSFEVNDLRPNVFIEPNDINVDSIECGMAEIIGNARIRGGTYEYIQVTERGSAMLQDVTIQNVGYTYGDGGQGAEIPLDRSTAYPPAPADCGLNVQGDCRCWGLHYGGSASEAIRVWHGGSLTGLIDQNMTDKIRQLQGAFVDVWGDTDYEALNTGDINVGGTLTNNNIPVHGQIRFVCTVYGKTYVVPVRMDWTSLANKRFSFNVETYGSTTKPLIRCIWDWSWTNQNKIELNHVIVIETAANGTQTVTYDAGVDTTQYTITAITL